MFNNIYNFNLMDKIIYSIEATVVKLTLFIRNENTPDPEEVILAATNHLQKENEELKEFRIPEKLIFHEETSLYSCPKCKAFLSQKLVEEFNIKFCTECGKRLFRIHIGC